MTNPDLSIRSDARDVVGSLEKGLAVLDLLATHPAGLTLTQSAERLGLTRAGARRLLLTLVASGYAAQEGRLFRLTPHLLSLTRRWLDGASLWSFALTPMRDLAASLNESCSAAVLSGEDIVYVARIPGERIVSVDLHVGTRLPAFCTSMGRVLLSDMPPSQLEAALGRARLHARTAKTVVDPAALMSLIGEVRSNGYALVDEELELGLRSLAVPVRDRAGKVAAAINVSTQAARFTPNQMLERILPPLRKAAADVENYFALQ